MLEERHFIPYQVSEPPPGPWLVFAPHADDETFGMGGSLLLAAAAGIETHVVVITDGALGGRQENLVQIRRREAQAAARFLSLSALQQWAEPDRGICAEPALVNRCKEAIRAIRPAHVFFPGSFEPHPDHRACAHVVWAALAALDREASGASGEAVVPIPVSYEIAVQSPINILLDITPVMVRKRQAMALYQSQNAENGYPALVEGLNKARTFSLPRHISHAEGFYVFSPGALRHPLKQSIDAYYENLWR